MISFASDYVEGAHEAILEKIVKTNFEQLAGYGEDLYSARARERIGTACGVSPSDVWLLVGGTQTNQIVIASMLRSYEGVISAETGHIAGHEAGAIELAGHKVLTLPGDEGKLAAETVETYLSGFYADANHAHMVFPGMVYISFPTEYGTVYTKEELSALSQVCRTYKIPLYIDGARLAYGLAAEGNDLTLRDLAELADVLYIGGTKVGALCGEAVVFTKSNQPPHFSTIVKQHGALLAKGRLLGIQFDVLFDGNLYFRLGEHAVHMARKMKAAFLKNGYRLAIDSPTNQIFVILSAEQEEKLRGRVVYSFWERFDSAHVVARFAASWATTEEQIKALEEIL